MKKPTKKPQKASTRKEKLIEGVVRGKTPAKASKDAGYSKSYSRANVYRELAKASIRERRTRARAWEGREGRRVQRHCLVPPRLSGYVAG
jgi:hypothetical protein